MRAFGVEVARVLKQLPDKGDDRLLVRSLGDVRLLAVADGVSMCDGGAMAAEAVIAVLEQISDATSAQSIYEQFLTGLPVEGLLPNAATTLTCGILSVAESRFGLRLIFDYFAIGDSPIWRVVKLPPGGRYAYQRYVVHEAPYPGETAKVYATVRPFDVRPLQGSVAFGRIDVPHDEVLVVCSDGFSERAVFGRDQGAAAAGGDPQTSFCHWAFCDTPYEDSGINAVLDDYDRRGFLYDDAAVIVARARDTTAVAQREAEVVEQHAAAEAPRVEEERFPPTEKKTRKRRVVAGTTTPRLRRTTTSRTRSKKS